MPLHKSYANLTFPNAHTFLFVPILILTTITLIITTILTATILSSIYVSADDSVVDEINITVPVSCTLSGTGMDTHNANINNGLYEDDIGTTTLHAFCNDNEGFAIYAAGYTGNEIGGQNSNKLVGTTASNNATIESGTATTAGNPDVSNWAMKLAISQDSGDTTSTNAFTIDSAPNEDLPSQAESGATPASFSQYHVVPNEYTKVAHKNSGTDMTTTTGGVKLTTTYAAYISKTQPADTYSGQVIYTLVHPASASAPVACAPNGTTISTIACMQDITSANRSAVLASMTEETQYTLKDKRDGKSYTISKLADGKVWMTQNLDLDIDSSRTYTNEDTDLGWNTQTNTYQTASWTPSRSTYATATNNIHEWCQGGTYNTQYGGYCEQNNTPESYDPGDLYWNTTTSDYLDWDAYYNSCDYSATTPSCDESLNPLSDYVSSTGTQQYHLGNYYNWPAAIASNDASIYGAYNDTTGEYENPETNQSICPAGWTLPYVSSDGLTNDFTTLWTEYGWDSYDYNFTDGISTIWSAPLYFTSTSYFFGGLGDIGGNGSFWSSVAYGDYVAVHAYFEVDGYADPEDSIDRYGGNSVRCVLRQPSVSFDDVYAANNKTQINNHYAIQDLDDSMCGSVSIGEITTVIDVRDNNTYMIRKMKDENCWMLENLRLNPTDSTTASNMSASNTNAPAAAITNYLNGGNSGHIDGWSSVAVANSYGAGTISYTEPRIDNNYTNTLVTAYGPASVNEQAKTGVFYNYCAASMGTYCYAHDESYVNTDIPYDVCPINWQMPIGSRVDENDNWNGGFYDLYKEYDSSLAYSDSKGFSYNLSLPLSGVYYNGAIFDQNMKNAFWTRTSNKNVAAVFGFDLDDDANNKYAWWVASERGEGSSIRCLVVHD